MSKGSSWSNESLRKCYQLTDDQLRSIEKGQMVILQYRGNIVLGVYGVLRIQMFVDDKKTLGKNLQECLNQIVECGSLDPDERETFLQHLQSNNLDYFPLTFSSFNSFQFFTGVDPLLWDIKYLTRVSFFLQSLMAYIQDLILLSF